MIEPKEAAYAPILDDLTRRVTRAWRRGTTSKMAYRGWHSCFCGAQSDNRDHFVELDGRTVLTNSLAIHYVARHRAELPEEELAKILRLPPPAGGSCFDDPSDEELQ